MQRAVEYAEVCGEKIIFFSLSSNSQEFVDIFIHRLFSATFALRLDFRDRCFAWLRLEAAPRLTASA
jgi:hypothetical protein